MSKKDKQYTIYIRSTKESIPVCKEEFDAYYHDMPPMCLNSSPKRRRSQPTPSC